MHSAHAYAGKVCQGIGGCAMFPPVPGPGELSGPAHRRSRLMRRETVVRGARPAVVLMAAERL